MPFIGSLDRTSCIFEIIRNPLWNLVLTVYLLFLLHIHPTLYLLSKLDYNYPYFFTQTFVDLWRYCCLYRNTSWCYWSQTVLYFCNRWLVLRYRPKMQNPLEFSWYLAFAYHRFFLNPRPPLPIKFLLLKFLIDILSVPFILRWTLRSVL